jgi:hypothetical protein
MRKAEWPRDVDNDFSYLCRGRGLIDLEIKVRVSAFEYRAYGLGLSGDCSKQLGNLFQIPGRVVVAAE